MTDVQACAASIAHWNRMVAFACTQDEDGVFCASVMWKAIEEAPNDLHCPLCREYISLLQCGKCPLKMINQCCPGPGSAFENTMRGASVTWKGFIYRSKRYMLPALEKALRWAKTQSAKKRKKVKCS
jgi:hypothetical protein